MYINMYLETWISLLTLAETDIAATLLGMYAYVYTFTYTFIYIHIYIHIHIHT
jgi:hypothetical protein